MFIILYYNYYYLQKGHNLRLQGKFEFTFLSGIEIESFSVILNITLPLSLKTDWNQLFTKP
jgi:hypothetical protein